MTDQLYVRWADGAVVEGPMPLPRDIPGVINFNLHPNPSEYGWYAFEQTTIPEGKVSVTYGDDLYAHLGHVFRTHILEDAPPPPPPPVPREATAAQCRLALYDVGLLDDVEAMIAEHPYPPVRIWFSHAQNWERGNPYVAAMAIELGLTEAQVDDLFRAAALKV